MNYKYTLEMELPISVNLTLQDVESLLKLLDPIAEDNEHAQRWEASRMRRELKEIRRSALNSSSSQLTYLCEKLEGEPDASF